MNKYSNTHFNKINIYVPSVIYEQLYEDARLFEIFKSDMVSVNMNEFLSLIIVGYYDDYIKSIRNTRQKIKNSLMTLEVSDKERESIIDSIMNAVGDQSTHFHRSDKSKQLSLKPTNITHGILKRIDKEMGASISKSRYLSRMLISYCSYPISKREQIVFNDQYSKIQTWCKNRTAFSFEVYDSNKTHMVIPFKVCIGSGEMFNYLLCAEVHGDNEVQVARSFRINRMMCLYEEARNYDINKNVLNHLELMSYYGPQYNINSDKEYCVKLTTKGEKSFRRIYWGRPKVDRIVQKNPKDPYKFYYFKGSEDQLFLYFKRFGEDVEIISPESLRNTIKSFHSKAANVYVDDSINEV